jgi:hypothetical protein
MASGTVVTLVVLLFIAEMLREGITAQERSPLRSRGQAFRTDAKCESAMRVILGGWELGENANPKEGGSR